METFLFADNKRNKQNILVIRNWAKKKKKRQKCYILHSNYTRLMFTLTQVNLLLFLYGLLLYFTIKPFKTKADRKE